MLLRGMPMSRLELARYLRRTMSGVEWDLWACLRARRLEGFKFRRKALIGPYIVDFACLSSRLIVEIGGEMYDRSPSSDAARGEWLETRGFRVLRFTPDDIRGRIDFVLSTIRAELALAPPITSARGPGFFGGRPARWHRPVERGRRCRGA